MSKNGVGPEARRALLARLLRDKASPGWDLPLSQGQQALWLLHRLVPGSAAYNVAFTATVRSALDAEGLRRAFAAATQRHEVLRATFAAGDAGPVQRIHPSVAVELADVDASSWSEEELRARLAGICRQPFDLEEGPVFRVGLYRRAPDKNVVLLTIHHIATDALSIGVLVDEWLTLYTADQSGTTASLGPAPARHADFVRWQESFLGAPAGEQMWEYWKEQLKELPSLDLPTDRTRPPEMSLRGATHSFTIDEALTASLRQLAQENETTLFVVLLAAFWALLSRYSGQEEVVVGSPTAGRSRREFERLVGYFVNPVVLRGDLRGDPGFDELVARARRVVLEALRNADFPFPTLVQRLNPRRDASRSPIFQVEFNLVKLDQLRDDGESQGDGVVSSVTLGGLPLETFSIPQQEGQFDLTLEALDVGGSLHANLKYATDLFDEATIRRMELHLQALLRGVVARPDGLVSEFALLTEKEREQLVVEWNRTDRDYPLEKTLHELIEEESGRDPERVAVVSDAGVLSYAELDRRSNQLAHRLRRLGIGPGSRVGVAMERSLELVVGLVGTLKAGGAYVPVDPSYPQERRAFMLEDARIPVLLTQERLRGALPAGSAQVLALDSEWGKVGEEPPDPLGPVATADDLAYVIYTSGSTGRPKGAMNAHRGIVNRLLWMQEAYGLTGDDSVLQKTPFSFDVSVWEFFWPLMTRARLVMARPEGHRDPGYLVRAIQQHSITTVHFVPAMLQAFVEEPGVEACHSLRRVICSGEALPAEVRDRFFERLDCELHNLYGPTEAAVDVTHWECRRDDTRKMVPIGRPVANTRVYVLDRRLEPQPVGVPGELHIGGVQVGRGYLGRPELTAERFIPDPFSAAPEARLYRTGDLARFLPDGSVEFLGRMDHQVKMHGFRIELGEIEAVLLEHSEVGRAVVVVREDRPGDLRLVGYYEAAPESGELEIELGATLRARLPDFMRPSALVRLEALPLLSNGKVNRRALPAPAGGRGGGEYVAPRQGTEETMSEIWSAVLGVDRVGAEDSFFELGGNSMLLLQVVANARQKGLQVEPLTLFRYPTVRSVAEHLDRGGTATPAHKAVRDRAQRQRDALARRRKTLRRA